MTTEATTSPSLCWRTIVEACRGITRREVAIAFMVAFAYFLYDRVSGLEGLFNPNFHLSIGVVIQQLVRYLAFGFSLMLAVIVADHITGKDGSRRGAYAVAVVASAVVATPVVILVQVAIRPGLAAAHAGEYLSPALFRFFEWLILGGCLTFVYIDWRQARISRARLHAAELERARAAKRTLESRLQALQARVEPQFLFNTLAHVRKLHRLDGERSERMLDDLIAYLRAAMPKMRDTSSTLWQELELARAYLEIVKARLDDRMTYEIDATPTLRHLRFPPMMLLPLIDHAITHDPERSTATSSMRILVRASEQRLAMTIADSGCGFAPETDDEGIEGIRERLGALYGGDASLVLRACDEVATEAVLAFPLEESAPETSADSVTSQSAFSTSVPGT